MADNIQNYLGGPVPQSISDSVDEDIRKWEANNDRKFPEITPHMRDVAAKKGIIL